MSFKDFLSKVHELEFMRVDAFGGSRFSMGHLRLWSDDRESHSLNFVIDQIDKDFILNGLTGRGEYFEANFLGQEYIHLYGANERQLMVFDGILTQLKMDGQSGLHLHGKYGYRGMPVTPLNYVPEPVNIHELKKVAATRQSKRGDEGSVIYGSSWVP